MSENRKELLELSMGTLFFKLAVPALIGMMAVGLYNMVDAIFVGQLVFAEGVGAIVVAYNITLFNMACAMLFAMGATSVLSRAIGEKDQLTIDKLFGNVLIGTSALSILLTIIVYSFAGPLLELIGAEGKILELGTRYLRIISLGFVFEALGPALNFLIRGEGQMKSAMKIIVFGVILNIILDPIFINGMGLGIEGAALATVLSQFMVVIGNILYFRSGKSLIRITRHSFKMAFDIMPHILNVGASGMLMQIMPAIQMSLMFKVLFCYGGSNSVVIMGASYRVMMFAFIALWGIAQGIQPIIGANYGAQRFDRVKKAFVFFTVIATGIAGVLWLSFMLFPKFILSWFITDPSLVQLGISWFRIFLGIFLLYGFMAISIVFFQAIGRGGKAALLAVGRQVLFFIPIVLLLPKLLDETGAWLAMPLGDFITVILSIILVAGEFRDLNKAAKNSDDGRIEELEASFL